MLLEYNTSYISNESLLIKEIEAKSKTLTGIIKGATLSNDFVRTVAELFPGFYIYRHKGSLKGAPRRAIQRGNPVYMIAFTPKLQLHYIIGFGTKDKYGWFGIHSDSCILVTDNGTQTERHNYLPPTIGVRISSILPTNTPIWVNSFSPNNEYSHLYQPTYHEKRKNYFIVCSSSMLLCCPLVQSLFISCVTRKKALLPNYFVIHSPIG